MNDYDREFLSVFNEYYPFERYILNKPGSLGNLFDDLLLTEIFVPQTEIDPIFSENGHLITFTDFNQNDIYIKVRGNAGEMRLGYFDFSEHIREQIRSLMVEDIGSYEYECLYVDYNNDYDNMDELVDKLRHQKELIIAKYGKCNIKESSLRAKLVM